MTQVLLSSLIGLVFGNSLLPRFSRNAVSGLEECSLRGNLRFGHSRQEAKAEHSHISLPETVNFVN